MKSKEQLIILRDSLHSTWQEYGASFELIDNIARNNPLAISDIFINQKLFAFAFLTSTRAYIRIGDKIAKILNNNSLQQYIKNLDIEFPDHKNSRDILEHLEDYLLGIGNLQIKTKRNPNPLTLKGEPISIFLDDREITNIQVYNLEPIDISKFAYWIDGFNLYLEKALHEAISPNIKWEGFNP